MRQDQWWRLGRVCAERRYEQIVGRGIQNEADSGNR